METASKEQQRKQWQNTLRARLMDRAKEGEQYREIIEQCMSLASQPKGDGEMDVQVSIIAGTGRCEEGVDI
jgi:hypothetical protein